MQDIPIRFENVDDMQKWFFVFTELGIDITMLKIAGVLGAA